MDRATLIAESVLAADNISRLISAMRRQAWLFIAFCLAGVSVGTLYVLMAEPLYTASANIILDNRHVRAVRDVTALSDPAPQDDVPEIVESQVEVLRSANVGLAVIKQLNLSEDQSFIGPPTWIDKVWTSLTDKLNASIGTAPSLNEVDPSFNRQQKALKTLNRNLSMSRVGHTLVLQVAYTSPDPSRAAEIANAFTNAYILEQLRPGIEGTQRARSWLQQRTEELRQLSVNADLAAQKFRADNNLFMTKGTLISEQQYNEMTTALDNTRAATAQLQARYLRIKNIIDSHQTEAAVTESLANAAINDLRTKYLNASARLSELERKLGSTHITVVNLKHELEALDNLLFQELARVAQSYRSDYEVAAAQEKALVNNFAHQQDIAIAANNAQVQLRELEQQAESYMTLYQTFLQRYQETAQQESFPLTDARVISAASRPLAPSYPRTPLVLAISIGLGILAGAGVAILRELTDNVFRTAQQVRDELNQDVLGMLPIVSPTFSMKPVPRDVAPVMRYALDNPFSEFVETLRSTKRAADLTLKDRSPKVIGLVSFLPKEGKSTVAKNLASFLASKGAKTLLVDADMRNPVLTNAIGCKRGQCSQSDLSLPPLVELLKSEPDSGLQFLPCIYAEDDPRVADGLSSSTLQALVQSSDQSFDYIVIDLPPVGPTGNARGIAPVIDAFIFVVAWGMTSRGAVRQVLAKEHAIRDKLLGVILNKVDMEKLKIYEHSGSDGYYHHHYQNYYKRDHNQPQGYDASVQENPRLMFIARSSAATLALKRAIDILGSAVGLLIFSPLFLAIAVVIKLDSPGPVFFRQVRIGRGGRPFRIFKFRSMVATAPQLGPAVTVPGDSRITRVVGAFLRRSKLDELPQLINVLTGDMSLVGPRPEVPEFMNFYTPEQRAIMISLRPGMTDYASILFRDESSLLYGQSDPIKIYIRDIMPIKFGYYERYTHDVGFLNDLRIIVATVLILVFKHVPKSFGIEHELRADTIANRVKRTSP